MVALSTPRAADDHFARLTRTPVPSDHRLPITAKGRARIPPSSPLHPRLLPEFRTVSRRGARIDENRSVQIVREEDELGILAIVQLEPEIIGRKRLGDGLLCLRLANRPDPQTFRFSFGANPNRIALPFRPGTGDFGVFGRNRQLEFLLFFFCCSLACLCSMAFSTS